MPDDQGEMSIKLAFNHLVGCGGDGFCQPLFDEADFAIGERLPPS